MSHHTSECTQPCFLSPVGHKAPLFKLPGVIKGDFKEFALEDNIKAGKWTVLFWYPLDFTFVCPTEIEGFGKQLEEFKKINAEVWGVSTDSKFSHKAWMAADPRVGGIGYPLLADFTKEVTSNYGILKEELGAGYRGTFIIDPQGMVRSMIVNDLSVGRSVAETLRTVQALQMGENCPIDWKPGQKTLGK